MIDLPKFSLLMAVYVGESPAFFKQCLDSLMCQTVLPDEFVLVKDGPLTAELESVIAETDAAKPGWLRCLALPENLTQGPARAAGLLHARYDWVATMDSDDICRPDRFEKQLSMIKDNPRLGLIGSQITEFQDIPEKNTGLRRVPQSHADILRYAKQRNPINSMTVLFNRRAAIEAGNYRYFPGFEDYSLWARMIKNGVLCANSPEALVYARTGGGMYKRRRGLHYIGAEYRMQKELRSLGLINFPTMMLNLAVRAPVRLLPEKLIKAAYTAFVREQV